jgi:hypothetical protein
MLAEGSIAVQDRPQEAVARELAAEMAEARIAIIDDDRLNVRVIRRA